MTLEKFQKLIPLRLLKNLKWKNILTLCILFPMLRANLIKNTVYLTLCLPDFLQERFLEHLDKRVMPGL